MNLESAWDLPKNSERLLSIGSCDDRPGDESESYSDKGISNHGDEEESLGYILIR